MNASLCQRFLAKRYDSVLLRSQGTFRRALIILTLPFTQISSIAWPIELHQRSDVLDDFVAHEILDFLHIETILVIG